MANTPYSFFTRTSTTLASGIAPGATTMTLSSPVYGTPTNKVVLTVADLDSSGNVVAGSAADFRCTVAGTAVSSMVLLNGTDQAHASGSAVFAGLVDEHLAGLTDGTSFANNVALAPRAGGVVAAGAVSLQAVSFSVAGTGNTSTANTAAWPTPFTTLFFAVAQITTNTINNQTFVNGTDGSTAATARAIVYNTSATANPVTVTVVGFGIV